MAGVNINDGVMADARKWMEHITPKAGLLFARGGPVFQPPAPEHGIYPEPGPETLLPIHLNVRSGPCDCRSGHAFKDTPCRYPGDDHTKATCELKFDNRPNFGGFERGPELFIPALVDVHPGDGVFIAVNEFIDKAESVLVGVPGFLNI